jgi:hypothetical protein
MFGKRIGRQLRVGLRVLIQSARNCHGKPKFPAWEQYVGLQGKTVKAYLAEYGPLMLDGMVGSADIYFYNIMLDDEEVISVPEEMLEPIAGNPANLQWNAPEHGSPDLPQTTT